MGNDSSKVAIVREEHQTGTQIVESADAVESLLKVLIDERNGKAPALGIAIGAEILRRLVEGNIDMALFRTDSRSAYSHIIL
jgi:hypothetical protein